MKYFVLWCVGYTYLSYFHKIIIILFYLTLWVSWIDAIIWIYCVVWLLIMLLLLTYLLMIVRCIFNYTCTCKYKIIMIMCIWWGKQADLTSSNIFCTLIFLTLETSRRESSLMYYWWRWTIIIWLELLVLH